MCNLGVQPAARGAEPLAAGIGRGPDAEPVGAGGPACAGGGGGGGGNGGMENEVEPEEWKRRGPLASADAIEHA
jgi:hypothetical protein